MCSGRNAQPTLAIGSWPKVLLSLILLWATEAVVVNALALKGCVDHCGNVSIPYPFGTKKECYMDSRFLITCNHSYNPPLAFLGEGNVNVTDIWLTGELRAYAYVAFDCYNQSGQRTSSFDPWFHSSRFPISNTRNKFTAIGCDTSAVIEGSTGTAYTTGCISLCNSKNDVISGSCSGIGCCQTDIPKGVQDFSINVTSYSFEPRKPKKGNVYIRDMTSSLWKFNPCNYAFLVEEGAYNFSVRDLQDFRTKKTPVVLNWAIRNQTCSEAIKDNGSYACKDNSECYDWENGPGYFCNCSKGFKGNPYHPDGCRGYYIYVYIYIYIHQFYTWSSYTILIADFLLMMVLFSLIYCIFFPDIDECQENSNLCVQNHICTNLPGTYNCSCQPGYQGDGKSNGKGCTLIPKTQKFPLMNRILLGEKHI